MDIAVQLSKISEALSARYYLNGRQMTYDEVFNELGLLPAIARRADQLSSLCLGYGIGVTFAEAKDSLLGIKAVFDDATPNALRYFFITDVLNELIKASPEPNHTKLDELMYD